ncbi:unnamed protein product [Arabidopsis lyrata]|nr:unnamed protein product [Arabidopsis lyrata]
MEQIRGSNQLVLTVTCLICLWFSVGMSSDSDPLIKTYVSSSLPSNNGLVSSADWCDLCHLMLPTLFKLDIDYKDQFKFYTVDISKEASIAIRYMVRAIPTTIVVKGGGLMTTFVGGDSRKLEKLVERYK